MPKVTQILEQSSGTRQVCSIGLVPFLVIVYSYFEKGCREKCTRQSWKALWVVLSSFFQRNLKGLARKTVEMCLRVLKESNKVVSTTTVVRNSVLIMSHITFRACCGHSFSDNLSRNSCKKIDSMLPWVCSVIDQGRRQNVTHITLVCGSCATYFVFTTFFCPLWSITEHDAQQHGIYLLKRPWEIVVYLFFTVQLTVF